MDDGGDGVGRVGFDFDGADGVVEAVRCDAGAEGGEGVFGEVTAVATWEERWVSLAIPRSTGEEHTSSTGALYDSHRQ